MSTFPVEIEEGKTLIEANPEDFDSEFLKLWGFTLRDTYRLALRFYKGKKQT
jgi:hypothetical protein